MDSERAPHILRKLLRPAVLLALRYGIQLNEMIEILKGIMVEAAERSISSSGESTSASRVSAMTGVHRKDVARLANNSKPIRSPGSLISRVMAQWQNSARFTTKARKPRVLSCEGRASEFAKLVESVNGGDLSGYTLLFEMERRGIVERKHGIVKLIWRDYAPSDNINEQLEQWGEDTIDLGLAVEENLFGTSADKHHHLKTSFDNIPESKVSRIREWIMKEGSLFHQKVRRYLASQDRDVTQQLDADSGTARIVVGSFSFSSLGMDRSKSTTIQNKQRHNGEL